jgi:uncharacterized protein (TIGR02246 family)
MTTRSGAVEEAEIRQLVEACVAAIRAKDADGLLVHYATDVRSFDLAPPLESRGTDVYRRSLEEWFASFRGPIGYEVRDLGVTAADDVAFCHSLNRIKGARTNGENTDVWVRATFCCRKTGSRWQITHDHLSVPFEMKPPFKASLDLQPQ